MSQQAGLAQRHTNGDPMGDAHGEPVRPKVMRRPTHFSSNRPSPVPDLPAFISPGAAADDTPNLADPAQTHAVPAYYTPTLKLWQDDAKFGAVMIMIIIVTNIALMLWLPHIRPASDRMAPALVTREAPMASPQPNNSLNSPVTLYTNPAPAPLLDESEEPPVHILGAASAEVEQ